MFPLLPLSILWANYFKVARRKKNGEVLMIWNYKNFNTILRNFWSVSMVLKFDKSYFLAWGKQESISVVLEIETWGLSTRYFTTQTVSLNEQRYIGIIEMLKQWLSNDLKSTLIIALICTSSSNRIDKWAKCNLNSLYDFLIKASLKLTQRNFPSRIINRRERVKCACCNVEHFHSVHLMHDVIWLE